MEMTIESAVDTPSPNPVIFMDINIMTVLTGRERTIHEYRSAGRPIDFHGEAKTPSPYFVLEAGAE
jgi:hypothetical protein